MAKRNDNEPTSEEVNARLEAARNSAALQPKPTRRGFVRKCLNVAGPALVVGFHGYVFHLWEKYEHLKHSRVPLQDLFPMWETVQVVPGTHHPVFGYHHDVQMALENLVPLVPRSHPVVTARLKDLRPANKAGNLVLIGGPITNDISLRIHGYEFDKNMKISIKPVGNTGLRWLFYYPFKRPDDPSFSRYDEGMLRETMPKAIMDQRASGMLAAPRFSGVDYSTGMITSDFLLVTVIPNTLLRSSTGSSIIDIADLHGQGDKVFAELLRDNDRRRELHESVGRQRYFQALYEVPVTHDESTRETTPGSPRLLDVQVLS